MKSKHWLAFLSVVAVVALGYLVVQPDFESNQTAQAPGGNTNKQSKRVPEEATSPPIATKHNEKTAAVEHSSVAHGGLEQNCEKTYLYADDGSVTEAYDCGDLEPPPGPYAIYDDETLADMAYSDPLAAEELGKRLVERDPQRAYDLMVRSTALSKSIQPIQWLASAEYSLVARNGKPAIDKLSENYVLQRVSEELGTPGMAIRIRDDLKNAGFSRVQFTRLEQKVDQVLEKIRNIQVQVHGASNVEVRS